MSTKSRRLGSDFELRLVEFLRERGEDAERLRLTGTEDEGDIIVREPHGYTLIEAKNEAKLDLSGYLREAIKERDAYARHRGLDPKKILAVAVVKRRNRPISESYVITTLDDFFPED